MLTVATAAALLPLVLGTLLNLYGPYDRSVQESKGTHVWLYFDRDQPLAYSLTVSETIASERNRGDE